MVIRCGIYEMLEYLKQLENKEYKRLVPQIMVAFYTGPKKWIQVRSKMNKIVTL